MELDQLKGFFHVAKLKSFTRAAGKMYLTQPAISLQIKALEKELGEKLFERTGRRVSLTMAGEVLFRLAEEIVTKLDEIRCVIGELHDLERGRCVLGTSDTTSLYFIPELIKEYREAHPKIELQVRNRISQEVVRLVLDCEVDLGIVTLPVEEPRLTVVPLFKHPLACVVASAHPLSNRRSIRASDLRGEPMVALERNSTTRRRIDAYLAASGVQPRTAIELSSFETIKKFVAIGLGVAIVPERAATSASDGIRTVRFAKSPPCIQLGAIYRKDRFLPHPVRVFLELAQAYFQTGRGEPEQTAASPD